MKLLIGASNIKPNLDYPVVAIGNFDGVHLGHQAIIAETIERAKQNDGTAVVLTFEPHPRRHLNPEKTFKLLNTFQIKARLIEGFGIDVTYVTEFNKAFAELSPEGFAKKFLHEKIGCKEVVVGKNFRFGKDQKGTLDDLIRYGETLGFKVISPEPVKVEGYVVSSSEVRKQLMEGNVALAAKMLGRHYIVEGKVIRGDDRGAALGFPTANLRLPNELIPKEGIYAARADFLKTDGYGTKNCVVYIGSKPTFGQNTLSLEVHVLDFEKDLYEKRLRVALIDWVRGDERFESAEALSVQIQKDVDKTREILAR
ncbi:FMN adenylyltransferase / Riboflavin kinase [hydrothermal vent metagenome]|uniref:Bifunctional riboflavin kinase/FMN adenylyltransferase n=1 Tax=hydrothermal vent metagenome TaxID=652676 RepID=A0A3B1CYE7_9ZZZZ